MAECDEIKERLVDFADGTLDAAERERVVAHLAGCAGCRRWHVALEQSLATARTIWAESARVLESAGQPPAGVPAPPPARYPTRGRGVHRPRPAVVCGLAAAAAALATVFVLYRYPAAPPAGSSAPSRPARVAPGVVAGSAGTASEEPQERHPGQAARDAARDAAARVEREIAAAGLAGEMLAAADLLGESPAGRELAAAHYRQIEELYAGTGAAEQAQQRRSALQGASP